MSISTGGPAPLWPLRLNNEFHASDRKSKELLLRLNAEQLNRQPMPGAWSVGQCLEHLCIANEVYLPELAKALMGKPTHPVSEIVPGWFGRWFIDNFIEPSPRGRHARAPKKITPGSPVELSVLDRFLRGNQAARELVARAGEYDVNHIRFRNPFIPLLRFTIGTGLEIVSRHQRRHLMQAQRAKESLDFPRAASTGR